MKKIEGLRLFDLKLAFSNYLDRSEHLINLKITPKLKEQEWNKFWAGLNPHCSIVEKEGEI